MFDTLIEDFEEDTSPASDLKLPAAKTQETDEAAGSVDLVTIADPTPEQIAASEAEAMAAANESWSDDPVRMYLTQMGEIPLLTRKEEIALAKEIEVTRQRFRTRLLCCDYVIKVAYNILRRVHEGELPFDRTVQVSVTDRLEKDQILGRMPHNLRSLDVLLKRNRRDYITATSKSASKKKRAEAWKRLGRGRIRAVRLVEELGLRTQRIEPFIKTLADYSQRVDFLLAQIAAHKKSTQARERASGLAKGSPQYLACDARVTYELAKSREVSS